MKLARSLFVKEAILFGAVQALGLWTAFRFLTKPELGHLVQDVSADFHFTLTDFFILAVFIFLFIFLAVKRGKASRFFFRGFLWLIIFSGAQIVFSLFLRPPFALLASLAVVVSMTVIPRVAVLNIAVIFGLAGIGAILGLSIKPIIAVWILAILSLYDIVAVYWTKHMVKMAEGMIASRAIFGFIIPNKFSGFKEKISAVQPGVDFMILGSGDIALPLVLVVSIARVSFVQAFIVAGFSILGLLVTHLIFMNQKIRRPMAALPPIAALSIIGYLVASLI
ncbi:MAG: presenilin family intramembrane aspartyl protease [bacterium]|nr:presenilin family intramembrane aspartyl protease [bacterium]